MLLKRYINNISGLQFFHLSRFLSFLIISVVFTKSHLNAKQIGDFEILIFIASAVSFFWITGIVQSLLTLYNNNNIFPGIKDINYKSPEIFNTFLLILIFNTFIFILGHSLKNNIYVYSEIKSIPFVNLLLLYILLNNPTHLIEYIYVLRNKSHLLFWYTIITFSIQLILVILPIVMGYGIKPAFIGLILISGIRFIWLLALIYKYALFRFSWKFMKIHLNIGYPLIISTLLSGSAQYIDGILVANNFNARDFAFFRYGAKEFPLVVMLASGLHSGMIPEFAIITNFKNALYRIRQKSKRLINSLFPITIILLLTANWIFVNLFNPDFRRSADIFMIYLLLIISRLLFPQTILIGLKKTRIVMISSFVEIILNIILSLIFIGIYGLQGVVVATAIIYLIGKIVLITYIYVKLGIKPNEYIPVRLHLTYSIILVALFVLIDHRIIWFY
ncbi:MAG: polysaccharide biosynthesis C-terminal domain-containing protein [Bacteroidota bacterium]